jgi:hypothetical protein
VGKFRPLLLIVNESYLGSSGWTATAVSPSIVSTRVVATTISSPRIRLENKLNKFMKDLINESFVRSKEVVTKKCIVVEDHKGYSKTLKQFIILNAPYLL